MIRKILTAAQIFLALLSFFAAGAVYADSGTASTLCGGDALANLFCSTSITDMLNQLFQLSIALGGILAMLRIGYAGFLYMGSADMWSSKQHAKDVFRDAIIGLLILLAIYLILYQINPCILQIQLLQPANSACNPTAVSH